MLYDNDIALVEKSVTLGFRDQDSCNAWERIKNELVELAQLSHNSAMRKLPTFDEFLNWRGDPVMSHDLRDFYFFFTGNYPQ
jgi:hypothetical protein